jgi:hypothetical protein
MRKMIEYIFELYYWVRPAGLIVQSVLTAKTLDQNQHPLSSKYCRVLKKTCFPTPAVEITKKNFAHVCGSG